MDNLVKTYFDIVERTDPMGCGTRAAVYDLHNGWVLRYSPNPTDGYNVLWDFPDEYLTRLSLPTFNRERSRPEYGFYVVKKLVRSDWSIWIGYDDREQLDLNNLYAFKKIPFHRIAKPENKAHPLRSLTKKGYVAWRFARRYLTPVSMDFNPSNIMYSPERNTLVLSDPFGYCDLEGL